MLAALLPLVSLVTFISTMSNILFHFLFIRPAISEHVVSAGRFSRGSFLMFQEILLPCLGCVANRRLM